MAKYLDQAGITVLVGQITNAYDERYAAISHTHTTANVISLGGYSATSVSGTTLTDTDSLNAALKKLYNLSSSKLSTIPISTRSVLGGIKVGKHYTGAATFSPVATDPATAPTVNSVSTTAGRYYAVETDSNGLAFVNVPWVDYNTTYTIATTTTAGLVKPFSVITKPTINSPSTTAGKYYHVEMSSDGNMFVNVPWTDTKNAGTVTSVAMTVPTGLTVSGSPITSAGTLALSFASGYSIPTTAKQANWDTAFGWGNHASAGYLKSISQASSAVLGGIKIGYAASGKNYAVQLDDEGKAFVNVPWVNTTYTAATTSTAGLMSAADKSKLDGIAAGATANKGTVTSVAMTVPTGLTVAGSPITSAGTLALTFTSGYSIPTTTKQTNWDTAYGWGNHASAGYLKSVPQASDSVLGGIKIGYTTSGKNYAVQLDEETGAAFVNVPWTDTKNPGTVTSVAMTVPTGLTVTGSPITSAGTLALKFTSGYSIPTTAKQANWDTAYGWGDHSKAGYTKNTGTVTSVTLTQGAGITVSSSGIAITTSGARTISLNTATNTAKGGFMPWMSHTTASTYNGGSTAPAANATVVNVNAISTTTGKYYAVETDSNGRAFVNVPWTNTTYGNATTSTAGLMSAADKSKLNGIAAGATANEGTVTSVAMTVPTGLTVSGSPITSAGTLALTFTSGYSIPTTAKQTNWDTAYGWGNHASAGYLKSVPQASSSVLGGIKIGYAASGKNYAVQLDSAGKAFVNVPWTDSNTNYYPTAFAWTSGTTAGPTGSLTGSGMSPVSFGAIPSASASASGVVTTGAQTFGGTKTLTATLRTGSTATTQSASDDSTKVATTAFVHDAIANDITALSEAEIQSAVEAALAAL